MQEWAERAKMKMKETKGQAGMEMKVGPLLCVPRDTSNNPLTSSCPTASHTLRLAPPAIRPRGKYEVSESLYSELQV